MGNLSTALRELRAKRQETWLQVEKLDQAISVIESLNGYPGHKGSRCKDELPKWRARAYVRLGP
jgi:hypothetical protein